MLIYSTIIVNSMICNIRTKESSRRQKPSHFLSVIHFNVHQCTSGIGLSNSSRLLRNNCDDNTMLTIIVMSTISLNLGAYNNYLPATYTASKFIVFLLFHYTNMQCD